MVENGDRIRLDVKRRQLTLLVDEVTLAARHKAWIPPPAHPHSARGYKKLYLDTVLQADEGCDFAFMIPPSSSSTEGSEG